ncbi:Permease GhxP/GhxQ family [Amphidinium carterae]
MTDEVQFRSKGRQVELKDTALDKMFRGGKVDNYFKVTQRGSNLTTEIRAGITTFLTAAYIMAVNPNILSTTGLNFEGLVFATAASSCVATLMMALWANLPFGLWPGMGMNAYFAYTIVGFKGTSNPVKKVMFAVFIEGIIFIVMSATDARRFVFKFFPTWMMKATMAGIGLFLAFIGLQAGNGIDIVRDHPAVLVDLVTLTMDHFARTWLGILFFGVMSLFILLKVKGAVMLCILMSAVWCWICEAAEVGQFTYKPMCCLGTVVYPEPNSPDPMLTVEDWYPKPGGGFYPKPTCVDAFPVPGHGEMIGDPDDVDKSYAFRSDATVTGGPGAFNITMGGTVHQHSGSILFEGISEGRDSTFQGGCPDTCHAMMGGFNPACFGATVVDMGCWTAMSYQDRAEQVLLIDGFGEGCRGGAGRIPKTFKAPGNPFAAPKIETAGDLQAPFTGWDGCDANGENCETGDVAGGTIMAWDTSDLDWMGFWNPLLTLLYVDFIGTMGFLYAAADLSGLVDPAKPETFPGCYAAFMADAVGTFVGGFLGTSSVTTYGESMAGVYEGGRTGMTALVIAVLNFVCIFLTPLLSSIPTLSTGPALVMVGVFMIEGVKDIDWGDYMQAIPSTICILLQITTYHIEYGVIGGFMVWMFMMFWTCRFMAYIPGGWKILPLFLQRYVLRQDLDADTKRKLHELGVELPDDKAKQVDAVVEDKAVADKSNQVDAPVSVVVEKAKQIDAPVDEEAVAVA